MLEITNIEYQERAPAGGRAGEQPYRCLVISVRLPDDTAARFLIDPQAIRVLDAPAAKGALLRAHVEKIVIRVHSGPIFSVVLFLRPDLARRVRSGFLALLQGASPAYTEEIGTSLQGFDPAQVAAWLRNVGYPVELVAVAPARESVAR
jgi:hypothetical protein